MAACLVVLFCESAWALGTPAGTTIVNTATVDYTLSGDPTNRSVSTANSFDIEEVIDTTLVWQDAAAVPVNSPQAGQTLQFLLTNTGNGPEAFLLAPDNTLTGDDFDPEAPALWLESNTLPGLQTTGATPDTVYQTGINDPVLAADESITIYFAGNIPSGLNDGDTGQIRLEAQSATSGAPGAPAGTALPGAGANGVDAVVGTSTALANAVGGYIVSTATVQLTKSIARIEDAGGGSEPFPGARVTYRIAVEISGSGTAQSVMISDAIPTDMTYAPDSIVLDGTPQTDASDAPADQSDFNVTSANTVTINLGDITAPAVRIIEFTTTINE